MNTNSIDSDIVIEEKEVNADTETTSVPEVIVGQSVNGIPAKIEYGIAYTITVNPPEAEQDVALYFVDKNFNLIKKTEGMVIGIPAWNSRLSSNFPEGIYRLVVTSADKVLVEREYNLTKPAGDTYRKVKASQ